MNSKHMIIIACAALFGATQAKAQGQSLPILTANPDSKTASMGNASVASDGMYLYNTPSAFFNTDKRFTADAAASLYEKEDGAQGLFGLYTATIGYKLFKRHSVFGGFRYAGGLKFNGYDMMGEPTKEYKPYDWTIDLGYSYMIGNGLAAYATGAFIFSHLSKNAYGGAFSVGLSYTKDNITMAKRPASVMIDAKVEAIGPDLDYGNGHKSSMPTHVSLGGKMEVDVTDIHKVGAALATRYFFRPTDAKVFMLGGGVEYTYNNLLSARAGYEYGDHNLSHFTMGAGVKYHNFRINGAYMLKTADGGKSYCTIGLGYDF